MAKLKSIHKLGGGHVLCIHHIHLVKLQNVNEPKLSENFKIKKIKRSFYEILLNFILKMFKKLWN